MSTSSPALFSMQWVIDNLLSELIFGVLLIGGLTLGWSYIRDAWVAIRVFRIISTHNNETRTRRKGFHARDRFMEIYEAGRPVVSRPVPYNTGFISGAFNEQYVDKGILEAHKLVVVKEGRNGDTVEVKKDRMVRWVYRIAKWFEETEKTKTERFVLDKSGKQRQLPPQ